MKILLALSLVALLATTAFSGDTAWYNVGTQTVQWQRPAYVDLNGSRYYPPTSAQLELAGWASVALECQWTDTVTDWAASPPVRCMTEQELAARAAEEAAAIAEAEEAALTPVDFPNGIALPAQTSGAPYFGVLADSDGDLVTFEAHASPYDDALAKSNLTAALTAKAAWKADLRALRDSIATNVNDAKAIVALTNNFTAAQCKTTVNDLRKELIDLAKDVKDLRKQLARYGRLNDE